MQPIYPTLSDLQNQLRAGALHCRAIVEQCISQIEKTRALNAFVEVWPEEALAKADALDRRLRENPSGHFGQLFGAVISIKDNICYAGHGVSAGSNMLRGFKSLFSATAVERLLAEDAILIGRTNCDEFGMGSSSEHSAYGPVKNGADPSRVAGGSSGGAAVSVQKGCCQLALGSDTGGSVRQPAGFCGLWGFKPTYGRISRHGLVAYASSFDQIGIIGSHVSDIATCLEAIEGPDDFDATVEGGKSKVEGGMSQPSTLNPPPSTLVFFPEMFDSEGLDAGIRSLLFAFIEKLHAAGHRVEPAGFDLLPYLVPTYYILASAEASSNLARYDGIRYGHRSPAARSLEETYRLSRTEGFGTEVKRRIMLGTFVLRSGYYDAYYQQAQRARRMIRERLLGVFSKADFILLPVAPSVAWPLGEKSGDPVAAYLADIYTVLASLAGVPALALPLGQHPENGLPVGVQLLAAPRRDEALLDFAGKLSEG